MTIAFATLFLGLVVGTQPVELVVGADVARVELLLDGKTVGERTGPPWEIPCDFGPELAPHELVAVALDAEGKELGRARQWVNLPPWDGEAPSATSDRTAVALEVSRRARRLDLEALAAHLAVDGRPVEPLAVEAGPAEVLLVMDRDAQEGVRQLAERWWPPMAGVATSVPPVDDRYSPVKRVAPIGSGGGAESRLDNDAIRHARLQNDMVLKGDQLVRFLWPYAEQQGIEDVRYTLFQRTAGHSPSQGGMLWFLYAVQQPEFPAREQRLADAVAVAGMEAAASGRPRAVLLVLSEGPADASRLSPLAVRRYLEHLGVPLHVWAVDPVPEEVASAWGGVRPVPKDTALRNAVKDLSASLERQRIVWIEGLHLPQAVELARETGNVRLVR